MLKPTRRAILASLAALTSTASAMPQPAPVKIRFTLDGRMETSAALFTLTADRDHFANEGLDIVIESGTGAREAITRVASNSYDMGFGDVNALIRFRDENPSVDAKAVMMIQDRPSFSIVGRKSRGVTTDIKSLEGKKFGAPAADAAFAQWPIFKAINKLDDSAMAFENVGVLVREPMLASGEVDAAFSYSNTSYVNLKSRGVPADDITLIMMSDFGLELYGSAVLASPKLMADNPDAIRRFLRALVLGVRDMAKDPDAAIESLIKRNETLRREIEVERLKMTLDMNMLTPWVKANGFGGIDPARWNAALGQIALAFPFKDKIKAGAAFTEIFLPSAEDRRVQ